MRTSSSVPGARILLVDDRPANLLALEAALTPLGEELVRAQSGEEALARLAEQRCAVVLMDVNMPGLDGFATADRIRKDPALAATPIVFVTAQALDPEVVSRACERGAADFVEKPLNPDLLRSKVAVLVELFHKTEQLERSGAEVQLKFSGEQSLRMRQAALAIEVGNALTRADTLPEMLQRCTDGLVRHAGAAFARIWTLQAPEPVLVLRASSGMYTHLDGAHARVPVGRFKIGLIAEERTPHLTNDIQSDPRLGDREWAKREGLVAFAGYPLLIGARVVGVMAMFARAPLSDGVLEMLGSIADSIALGIQRQHADDERARYTRQLRELAEAGVAINSAPSLDDALQMVTERARQLIGTHLAMTSLGTTDASGKALTAASFSDKFAGFRDERHDADRALRALVIGDTRSKVRLSSAELEAHAGWRRFGELTPDEAPLRGLLAVPLLARDGAELGLLRLSDKLSGEFTVEDEDILLQLAQMASAAVENAQLLEQSERTRAELEAVLEHAPAAISLKDGAGRFVLFNRAAELATGVERTRALGKTAHELFSAERAAASEELDQRVLRGRRPIESEEARDAGGHTRTFHTVRFPVFAKSGVVRATGAISTDISERKQAEEKLRANEQSLRELVKALERSNAELDQFAYVASHDLKAPLRGIANLTTWLEEDLEGALDAQTKRNMDLLRGRVQRMEALIDGILAYSRAGRARAALEDIDVRKLVDETVELLSPKAPARIEVALPDLTVHSERVPLQQVFLNLIGNALKHAQRADPLVRVTVEDRGELYEFMISDNGVGIAPEYQQRIWMIFQTLEPRDRVESTGIGLAVVKKIVDGRGGSAWVESEPERGARFHFTWPKWEGDRA